MEYKNELHPSQQQIEATVLAEDDGPIYMLNLLKYRERAEYPDGRSTNLTGREAYALYGAGVVQTLAEVGGTVVFGGEVVGLLLGQVEELWDDVAIAMYPSRAAMAQMFSLPRYQEIHLHREAGLKGQLNITTKIQGGLAESAGG